MDQDRSRRQIRVHRDVSRLLRSRTFFLMGVNALVSLVISILVVVVALRLSSGEAPVPSAPPEDVVIPAAATQVYVVGAQFVLFVIGHQRPHIVLKVN